MRFSPVWALAELAGFAVPCGLQIQLRQDGSLNPKPAAMLGCAGRAIQPRWLSCRSALFMSVPWVLSAIQSFLAKTTVQG